MSNEQRTRDFILALARIHKLTQEHVLTTTLHEGVVRAHDVAGNNIASMSIECLAEYSK